MNIDDQNELRLQILAHREQYGLNDEVSASAIEQLFSFASIRLTKVELDIFLSGQSIEDILLNREMEGGAKKQEKRREMSSGILQKKNHYLPRRKIKVTLVSIGLLSLVIVTLLFIWASSFFKSESMKDGLTNRSPIMVSGIKLVPIPTGDFMREGFIHRNNRVVISKPIWVGATEVTQSQYKTIMNTNPSYYNGENHPVENVSWDDAFTFCKQLTEREFIAGRLPDGYEFRLPTEAEWEYACRAGTTSIFAGTGNLDDMGWYKRNSSEQTHNVGRKKPNAWGIYDMHGNVSEWCSDWYGDYPDGDVSNPMGPPSGKHHVLRGGNIRSEAITCRSDKRDFGYRISGFRIILSRMGDSSIVEKNNSEQEKRPFNSGVKFQTIRWQLEGRVSDPDVTMEALREVYFAISMKQGPVVAGRIVNITGLNADVTLVHNRGRKGFNLEKTLTRQAQGLADLANEPVALIAEEAAFILNMKDLSDDEQKVMKTKIEALGNGSIQDHLVAANEVQSYMRQLGFNSGQFINTIGIDSIRNTNGQFEETNNLISNILYEQYQAHVLEGIRNMLKNMR